MSYLILSPCKSFLILVIFRYTLVFRKMSLKIVQSAGMGRGPIIHGPSNVKNSRVSNTSEGTDECRCIFTFSTTWNRLRGTNDIARVAIVTREDQGRGFRSR